MINFEGLSTGTLVAAHNAAAEMLGSKTVNKFADRATAEKRTRAMVGMIIDISKRPPPFDAAPYSVPADNGKPAAKPAADTTARDAAKAKKAAEKEAARAKREAEKAARQAAKPVKEPAAVGEDIGGLHFGQRPGSRRENLIKVFVDNRGKFVALEDLVAATYGTGADFDDHKGPVMMVMKGMTKMIEDNNLPVKIVKQKEGKDIAYGLIDKTTGG